MSISDGTTKSGRKGKVNLINSTCTTAIVGCMDSRFALNSKHAIREHLSLPDCEHCFWMTGYGGPYLIWPWAHKEVMNSSNSFHLLRLDHQRIALDYFLMQIKGAIINNPDLSTVALIWHFDCKCMKTHGHVFKDIDDLRNFMSQHASMVRYILGKRFSAIDFRCMLLSIDHEHKIVVEDVKMIEIKDLDLSQLIASHSSGFVIPNTQFNSATTSSDIQ